MAEDRKGSKDSVREQISALRQKTDALDRLLDDDHHTDSCVHTDGVVHTNGTRLIDFALERPNIEIGR
jgi:hypothetical protein